MAEKTTESGTQGKKNKVFKRPIDLTVINKVPTLDKYPVDKSPPSSVSCFTALQYPGFNTELPSELKIEIREISFRAELKSYILHSCVTMYHLGYVRGAAKNFFS